MGSCSPSNDKMAPLPNEGLSPGLGLGRSEPPGTGAQERTERSRGTGDGACSGLLLTTDLEAGWDFGGSGRWRRPPSQSPFHSLCLKNGSPCGPINVALVFTGDTSLGCVELPVDAVLQDVVIGRFQKTYM